MTYEYSKDPSFAKNLDAQDPLASFREKFLIPKNSKGDPLLYFCGNSLGLQPKTTRDACGTILNNWEEMAVESWFDKKSNWLTYHEKLNSSLAKIVGAKPEEIAAMNALTVNLHLLLVSFYQPTKSRFKILIEKHAFPSDQYAVKSQMQFHGFDPVNGLIEVGPRDGEELIRYEDIAQTIEEHADELALVMLSGMNYYTGQLFDMQKITRLAKEKGASVGFDLAHVAGNVPISLHDWNVDFAVWCTYKYLNSGPGGLGGAFVHESHHKSNLPRFEGWWGNSLESRFQMGPNYDPAAGANAWTLSTSPMLLLASLGASLEIFDEVGIAALSEKSQLMTGYLEYLIGQIGSDKFSIITPSDPQQRGCQLSISAHRHGKELFDEIIASDVICDWREPNVIRLAPTPLYNTFAEVRRFAQILESF